MALKIGRAASGSLSFHLLIKDLKIKNGHSRIKLAATPSEPFFKQGAELVASLRDHKTKFSLRSSLKNHLKKINWDESKLKPLKNHLRDLLDRGRKDPSKLVDLLHSICKRDCLPDFSLSLSPKVRSPFPQTATLQLVPGEPQSLNFQIIPHRVKKNGSTVKVKLAAILSTAGFSDKAAVLATISHGKKTYSYNSKLREILTQQHMTIEDLQPLKKFLSDTLKSSHKDPEIAVGLLSTYLKSGISPSFVVYSK